MKTSKTSWGGVAEWYDELVEGSDDSYQKNVLLPNLIRLVEPRAGMNILDVACGQGYFSRAFAHEGAAVIGCDISPELIALASKHASTGLVFKTASSSQMPFVADASIDVATIILALQNIEDLAGTLSECARALKPGGRLILALNHPAFRVLRNSSWQWDEATSKQYRRIDAYMTDQSFKIDMTPGTLDPANKKFTVSFHRPLQSYFKALHKSGLAVTRLEEWISHRFSRTGPRSTEEDRMRKEIPLFIGLEAIKM